MSYRKQQVESTLQRAISQVLARRLSDPRIVGLVSVTHVDLSADGRVAKVFVSVLPDRYQSRSVNGLRHAAGRIHALLRRTMAMRVVPRLEFRLDESLKKEATVFDAIRRGQEQDRLAAQQRGDDESAGLERPVRASQPGSQELSA